jgi:hypothetical protein
MEFLGHLKKLEVYEAEAAQPHLPGFAFSTSNWTKAKKRRLLRNMPLKARELQEKFNIS